MKDDSGSICMHIIIRHTHIELFTWRNQCRNTFLDKWVSFSYQRVAESVDKLKIQKKQSKAMQYSFSRGME